MSRRVNWFGTAMFLVGLVIVVGLLMLHGCKSGGIDVIVGSKQGPPLVCRIPVPHSHYASLGQERAQLDAANNLLQFCMAQWDVAK